MIKGATKIKSKRKFWKINNLAEDSAELLLYGVIASETWLGDEVTPNQFATDLAACGGRPLTVRVNSPGGDVFAAQAIYNQLKTYGGSIHVVIDGICASAATIVACAGNKVSMPDNALYMIHNPQVGLCDYYDAVELTSIYSQLTVVKQTIVNVYNKRTPLGDSKIGKMMDSETWMSAQDAFSNGFIDEITTNLDGTKCINEGKITINSVSFDTKMFKNSGKITEILNKKVGKMEEKMAENNEKATQNLLEKILNALTGSERAAQDPVKNEVEAERQRIIELDALKEEGNPVIDKIIDTAKRNGSTADSIKDYIEAAKGAKQESDIRKVITDLIKDQTTSGAEKVKGEISKEEADDEKESKEKAKAVEDVVNRINRMRGVK